MTRLYVVAALSVRFIFEHAAWSGLVGVSVVSWRSQNGEDINV